jgi:hypothetical protein
MCICEYIIVCYELEDSEMSHSDNPSTVNSKAGIYREKAKDYHKQTAYYGIYLRPGLSKDVNTFLKKYSATCNMQRTVNHCFLVVLSDSLVVLSDSLTYYPTLT